MNTKEQAAREYCNRVFKTSEDFYEMSFKEMQTLCIEDFSNGWDAGQKQLLDEAESGIELAITKVCGYYQHELDVELTEGDLSFFREGYKQGRISAAAELAAKDEELRKARELAREMQDILYEIGYGFTASIEQRIKAVIGEE